MALGKGGLCRVPRIRRSTKRILIFFRNFLFAECLHRGTRQRHFEKKISLPSAVSGAHGKVFFLKKIFAECVVTRPRQVAKASDGEVSPRRLRPSKGGDLALTKETFLAMLVGRCMRLSEHVADSTWAEHGHLQPIRRTPPRFG